MLEHFKLDAAPGRHRVRLDAERADAGARGRREVGQPLAREGVPRRGVPRALRGALRPRRDARPVPRAQARAARAGDRAPAGTTCTRSSASRSRSTTGSCRRSPRATSRLRRPARSTGRSTSWPSCDERRGADRGAVALVLHSHMPYVEGFGTWPFGEEWLWEAVATVYLPLLDVLDGAPVTLGLTPVLCDQLETLEGDAGERFRASCATSARRSTPRTPTALERTGEPDLAAELRRAAGDYVARRRGVRAARAATCSARSARCDGPRAVDLHRRPTRCCRCWPPTPGCGCRSAPGSRRTSSASAATAGAAASGCPSARTRPGLERDLAEHGVRCVLRRPDRRARASARSTTSSPSRTAAGPVAVPDRLGRPSQLVWDATGLPVDRRLPRLPRPHRRTTCARGTSPATPTTTTPAPALAREHARDFVAALRRAARRLPRRARPARPRLLRDRHRAARPLVVRGRRLAERGARTRPSARACRSCAAPTPWTRSSRSERELRRRPGAARRT